MDRRQRKLEQKRKKRELVHKRARVAEANKPTLEQRLWDLGARAPFGPCALSRFWDNEKTPELVTAVITRALPDGEFLPAIALVDRTCLGVKNAFVGAPVSAVELGELLEEIGRPHGGMETADALMVQSLVFNAIDYARRLGFEPHSDFPADLFGPRPAELIKTPWHIAERPLFMAGPDDNVARIQARLVTAVGASNFDFVTAAEMAERALQSLDEDEDDEEP